MRKALWFVSGPLVAGGLAWAVNAADHQETLLARTPAAQNGQIFYFSRSGKTGATESETAAATAKPTRTSAANDQYADEGAASTASAPAAQRYVRTRTTADGRAVKNYYQDLFGDASADTGANSRGSTGRTAANVPATRQQVVEECGIDEASPKGKSSKNARETHKLPPAPIEQAGGIESKSGGQIQHAEYESKGTDPRRRQVEQVQYTGRQSAGTTTSRFTPRKPATQPVEPTLPADFDLSQAHEPAPAPPPAAVTRPAATPRGRTGAVTKTTPPVAKPTQTASATPRSAPTTTAAKRPAPTQTRSAPPVAAAKPKPAPVPVAVADEIAEADVKQPAVEPAISETTKPTKTFRSTGIELTGIGAGEAPQVPLISLRWVSHGEVNVGQECKCSLVVKNNGKAEAKDILVDAFFPRTVRLIDASPFPTESKDHLSWAFEHFDAGEEKTIEITMIPAKRGDLATSATVRFTGVASNVLKVEEPQLSVALSGPKQVMVGETVTSVVTVSNPGSGVAHDVVVHAVIPEAFEHARGPRVEIGVGSLGPGESREVRLALAAVGSGDSVIHVEARGAGSLIQRTAGTISVAAPQLAVEVTGPALRYINRHAQYAVNVHNEGAATANNVRVVHVIPEGFEFVRADKGGKFDSASGTVSWYVGRLEGGQETILAVELSAKQIGNFQHHVQVSGEHGSIANAKLDSRIDGTAALVMEVIDLDDPVEVGAETAYEIRIRNEGSKAAQSVRLDCELPQGLAVIDTTGPSEHRVEKGLLQFRPIDELPAGAKTVYRVKIAGKIPGNLRMRARLTSNASNEPLVVEELTKFYAD